MQILKNSTLDLWSISILFATTNSQFIKSFCPPGYDEILDEKKFYTKI